MRISDWSSDVCSSDLPRRVLRMVREAGDQQREGEHRQRAAGELYAALLEEILRAARQQGGAPVASAAVAAHGHGRAPQPAAAAGCGMAVSASLSPSTRTMRFSPSSVSAAS